MRAKYWLLILVSATWMPGWALGQGALDRLERQLHDETVGTTADDGEAEFEPGYLGVIADDRGENGAGVRVVEVIPDGPAFAGGLRGGDLITGITNRPVRSLADLARLLETQAAGSEMIFQIVRNGEPQELRVTLGRRPSAAGRVFDDFGRIPEGVTGSVEANRPLLGIKVLPIDPATRAQYELPTAGGARIVEVTPGTPAAEAQLPVEGIVVALDGMAVNSPADLALLARKAGAGTEIELAYYFRGELVRRTVRLAEQVVESPQEELPAPGEPARREEPKPRIEQRSRLDAMEEQIKTLEQRVGELEQMLKRLTDAAMREGELSP